MDNDDLRTVAGNGKRRVGAGLILNSRADSAVRRDPHQHEVAVAVDIGGDAAPIAVGIDGRRRHGGRLGDAERGDDVLDPGREFVRVDADHIDGMLTGRVAAQKAHMDEARRADRDVRGEEGIDTGGRRALAAEIIARQLDLRPGLRHGAHR